MSALIVNFIGGPGARKSTVSAAVFSLLKFHNVKAEFVTEIAKDLTWEDRQRTLQNSYYVWARQHQKIWLLENQVDVIVSDTSLLLSFVYGEQKPESFYETVLADFRKQNNMTVLLKRVREDYDPIGRNQTHDEAKQLDKAVEDLLNKYKIPHIVIEGNHTGANNLANIILTNLGSKQIYFLNKIENGGSYVNC